MLPRHPAAVSSPTLNVTVKNNSSVDELRWFHAVMETQVDLRVTMIKKGNRLTATGNSFYV